LKIRDELRIAFGAKEDRIALAVSYQKSFLNIKEFDVNAYSSGLIDAYCKTDGLILTPYSLLIDSVSISLVETAGTLPADKYYCKASGITVNGDEILLTEESSIILSTTKNINIFTLINAALMNKKLFSLNFYTASDTGLKVFYYFGEVLLQNTEERLPIFAVSKTGEIKITEDGSEYHDPTNLNSAANITSGDLSAISGWEEEGGAVGSLLKPQAGLFGGADPAAQSDYVIDFQPSPASNRDWGFAKYRINNLPINTVFEIKFYMKRQAGTLIDQVTVILAKESYGSGGERTTVAINGTWTLYTVQLKSTDQTAFHLLTFEFRNSTGQTFTSTDRVRFDLVSVKKPVSYLQLNPDTEQSVEMEAEFGYTPSRNLIRSWDWGLVTAGRTFVSNVFIEKLYTNKIFFSPIGGDGNVMYDVLTAGNYYDVENFDGNDVRKIELLANADFLLLQSLAAQRLDPDTGRLASVGLATGIIQPHGSVNFGDRVMFPGKYDVLVTNGLGVDNASKYTIRPYYRDLADADIAKMHAAADPFEKAYSLYSGKTSTKAEFILTESGWIERRMALEPQRYAVNREGSFEFLSSGYIYSIGKSGTDDNGTDITSLWQSVIIDSAMLGEGIPENQIFVITDFFVSFLSNGDLTFKLYLMDKLLTVTHETRTIAKTTTTGKIKHILPLKKEATCSRFQLELGYTGDGGPSECSIFSVGVIFNLLQRRTHA